ncbi:MAG TPA: ABC transporter ATP-binding protein [Gemmatimonadaceae bacterium]|nr:ABC transporter ATP-binding protein [Gemmatimonadaceae bacterium]
MSKRFVIGGRPETLRDLIPAGVRAVIGRRAPPRAERWALRDVSFSIGPGDTLGLLGPNGAGKSTLLRILSRILRPTTGHVEVRGRIAALIELSAGFHFELTGRENVFLQGAVFGLSRREIAHHLDAIVDFAGVAPFIDVPLKRYSTGMVARLGFAIAAHVDTEILLVDEVLAVGDAGFQRKAIAHIRRLVRDGRPVVLVSHNLERLAELCSRALLLRDGRVAAAGTPAECIAAYIAGDDLPPERRNGRPVHIGALSLRSAPSMRCGERLMLHLAGVVSPRPSECRTTVAVRVRALPSEEAVFRTDAVACGAMLPESGAFNLEIGLDMNVGPGFYRIESLVGEPDSTSEWARGPTLLVRVERRPATVGRAYLNPAMRLLGEP